MNAHQENIISRNFKIRTFFNYHLATLSVAVPQLSVAVGNFNNALDKIGEYVILSTEDKTGNTLQKKVTRHKMQQLAIIVANGIKAYAIINDDSLKAEKVSITPSALAGQRDVIALYTCGQILEIAQADSTLLIPYGIAPGRIAELQVQISLFSNYIQLPIDEKAEAVSAGKMVKTYIAKCNEILIVIDALMQTQMQDFEQLYLQYKGDRRIDDN